MTPPLPEFRSRLRRPYRHSLPRRSPRSISRQPKALITLVPSSSGRRRQLVRRLRGDGFSQSLQFLFEHARRAALEFRVLAGDQPGQCLGFRLRNRFQLTQHNSKTLVLFPLLGLYTTISFLSSASRNTSFGWPLKSTTLTVASSSSMSL